MRSLQMPRVWGATCSIYFRRCLYPIALRACSATGLHSWCRLPGECLLRRHQKSSQTSAMTKGECRSFLDFALCFALGCRPLWAAGQARERSEKLSKLANNVLKCCLGAPLGGIWAQLGPQVGKVVPKSRKMLQRVSPFGGHSGIVGQPVGVFLFGGDPS